MIITWSLPNTHCREEHESWNASQVDTFCPRANHIVTGIECIDNKDETLRMSSQWVNKTEYSALCDIQAGLVCRPNKTHCPDFRIRYTCRCPDKPSTSIMSSSYKPYKPGKILNCHKLISIIMETMARSFNNCIILQDTGYNKIYFN